MALFQAGGADLAHDVGHPLDRLHHFLHGAASQIHQRIALIDARHAGLDEGLDFTGCLGAAPGQ